MSADAAAAAAAPAAMFGMPACSTASPRELSFSGVRTSQEMMSAQQTEHGKQLHLPAPLEAFSLMKAALRHGNHAAVALLAEFCNTSPLALEQRALADLVRTAMQHGSVRAFCKKVPRTLDLPARHLAPLLLLAVENRNYLAVHDLLQLPNAAAISTAAVMQLLATAVEGQAGEQLVCSLLALPECKSIDSDSAADLLESSLQYGPDFKVLTALLEKLPAAATVQPHRFADVLTTAATKCKLTEDSLEAVEQLIASQAAESLDAAEVYIFLMAAAKLDRAEMLDLLCELPAAQQLPPEELYQVMRQALQHSRRAAVMATYALCTRLRSVAV
jgi:hypothetical protein